METKNSYNQKLNVIFAYFVNIFFIFLVGSKAKKEESYNIDRSVTYLSANDTSKIQSEGVDSDPKKNIVMKRKVSFLSELQVINPDGVEDKQKMVRSNVITKKSISPTRSKTESNSLSIKMHKRNPSVINSSNVIREPIAVEKWNMKRQKVGIW